MQYNQGGDTTALITSGLPDINGILVGNRLSIANDVGGEGYGTGAFQGGIGSGQGLVDAGNYGAALDSSLPGKPGLIRFNAHNSCAIYGNSSEVQPPALQLVPQLRY